MTNDDAEKAERRQRAMQERDRLKAAYPEVFDDGARCGYSGKYPGPRDRGGYPKHFQHWHSDKRNAWFAGWNVGRCDREREWKEEEEREERERLERERDDGR